MRSTDLIVPKGLELLPFQVEGSMQMLKFLKERQCVYNASEQGLGKSIMTAVAINALQPRTALIICPAVMRLTWQDFINKWCLHASRIHIINKAADWRQYHSSAYNMYLNDIVVTSYNLIKDLPKEYDYAWDLLICDEAHYLKNIEAERSQKVLNEIWPDCKYKIALSGTPFTQSVKDGFNLFHRMAPEEFPCENHFLGEYAYCRNTLWGKEYTGVRNADKLKKIIRSKFFVRYLKEDVLPDLPDKILQKVTLPESYAVRLSKEQEEKIQAQIKAFIQGLKTNQVRRRPDMKTAQVRKLQALKKVPAVVEFVKNLLDQEQPTIVFAYHTDVINLLLEKLSKYNPVVIKGDVPSEERHAAVQQFQNGFTNLFIGQVKAAGVGISLTRAKNVAFAELTYDPAEVCQAIDRAHRIGTKDSVNVYYFIVENSIDTEMTEKLMQKSITFSKIID